VTATSKTWPGTERRNMSNGRRETDQCAEHCIIVKQWDDHIRMAETKAPFWALKILIGMVVVSSVFTFTMWAQLSEKFNEKITESNKEIARQITDSIKDISEKITINNQTNQTTLIKIQTDLAVAQSRQADIKQLIEKHMANKQN
jgi:type IV secretory pathway TrbF-like protein